jgi:hypothetical protein
VDAEVKGPTTLNYRWKPVLISKQRKLKPIVTKSGEKYAVYRNLTPLLKISKRKIFGSTDRSVNKVTKECSIR